MISILLATYNGERYIAEQIESVLNQSVQNFMLFINDDCSTDKTYEIIREYEKKYPEKIKGTRNQKNSGSAKYNFMNMMLEHKDEYVMLCDQDDVWLTDKIEITLKKMKENERKYGKDKSILVHTDLSVVDEGLNIKAQSMSKLENLDFNRSKVNNLVIQNIVTGCTVCYNKALADLLKPTDDFIIMHDWWLAVLASTFGVVDYCKEQTMLYRQHGSNSVGAKDMKSLKFIVKYMTHIKSIKKAINDTYLQCRSFYELYGNMLNKEQKKFFEEYIKLPDKNKIMRVVSILKLRVFKSGLVRNIGFIFFI